MENGRNKDPQLISIGRCGLCKHFIPLARSTGESEVQYNDHIYKLPHATGACYVQSYPTTKAVKSTDVCNINQFASKEEHDR